MQEIKKIVITGGPCAGKSTAMSWVQNAFSTMGYKVLFISETATELITGGVAPWTCGTNGEYQNCQMILQIEKEKVYTRAANTMEDEKILIVCDRGTMDNKAYMTEEEFCFIMDELNTNETALRDEYGAVFHLVTAAKGAEEYYTTSNNSARRETPEQAAMLDDKLISAWTGHPHFRIIDNSSGFEGKMKRLISEISAYLGEPEPYEIERKFLIKYPDIKTLENNPNCQKVDITQTYLSSNEGDEVRIRQRGTDGNYIYYKTLKREVSPEKRVEIEKRLSQNEYRNLLVEADQSKRQIQKTRYCLTYKHQYFEIDVYPFWKDRAIAEIELSDKNAPIEFPPEIDVIKEVTGDRRYKNIEIASNNVIPLE